MSSIVCTLFEGHYHYGVAALVNSLYSNGYRGIVYVGYKGELPAWATGLQTRSFLEGNASEMQVADGLQIWFVPLTTNYHLTNYKPDFMLDVWNHHPEPASGIFYFDPDIVVAAPWNYFETWIDCGVALCEDINSPLSKNHPRRVAWRNYFAERNMTLSFKDSIYVNGGFVGVHQRDHSFLKTWKDIQETMAPAIGGLSRSAFIGGGNEVAQSGPFAPFGKTDQDALNAAMEAWDGNASLIGKAGMAFGAGGGSALLPHALGSDKPWKSNYLKQALSGRSPRRVDKEFWRHSNYKIKTFEDSQIQLKKLSLSVAAFMCRFLNRTS